MPVSDRTELELVPVRWSGLANVLSLFGLALLIWGVTNEVARRVGTEQPVAFVLLAAAALS